MITRNVLDLIGNTPILDLEPTTGLKIFAKAEFLNPGGSIKDRVALNMIEQAEKDGRLKPGMHIVEPTSGSTGIGLALCGVRKGYDVTIVMPENMSSERRSVIKALGANLVLTSARFSLEGAVEEANRIASQSDNYFVPQQFENPANPEIHNRTTGVEIWDDTDGKVDIFVAGVGTGGTVSGVGKYLKSRNPGVKIVAVEPKSSPVLSEGKAGPHKIQGIGAGFIPETLDTKIYDEVITVENEDAFTYGRLMAKKEGVLVGISSGAALWAAIQLAKRPENKGKTIVALLPDTGDRYLSTPMFTQ